ncbi:uroporphyrinogen-III C-methyltransferase [Pelomonas cellulosilytica]|uniref:uroporphyrinogen-III C-methyltransferase n=1 Tax=Pelomonas cellulosilytica TaxID=2906762 RepID=A0ABS8Y0A4_9BURK|nr:uroporphyrinogen-III C-methyltransferase [Pelomonas sp. P8]MCE4556456.1 uroporphyrinogen-III C-methyltransferase [Pelomonas sp. P8]
MTLPIVSLVGAGPGDPELLTMRAVKRIEAADVVLADDLVDPRVLALVKGRLLRVGKRGGWPKLPRQQELTIPQGDAQPPWERPGSCISTDQHFIHALMIREARAGHRVVRLKGGDPFVFGRGGEEVDALREAGIDVEVVSGLTSGIAGPAAVGIPVTDRRASPGVILVTGHPGDGRAEPDWPALARTGLTLVIYMGVARASHIGAQLLAAGLRADLPAAVISAAHTAQQRHAVTTLADLADCIARERLPSPALLVIGEVAAHASAAELGALARSA